MNIPLYRIRNWNQIFETNETRKLKKLGWVRVSNSLDTPGHAELLDHEDPAGQLAAWVGIMIVASKCSTRGTLTRNDGTPLTAADLARMTRLPESIFQAALPRLVKLAWVEVSGDSPGRIEEKRIELNRTEGNRNAVLDIPVVKEETKKANLASKAKEATPKAQMGCEALEAFSRDCNANNAAKLLQDDVLNALDDHDSGLTMDVLSKLLERPEADIKQALSALLAKQVISEDAGTWRSHAL